ncbi:hypothetical protein MK131_15455 [Candidatus Poribacteria bacterium]|nr:hypothetical protein [Candidatus Poribacteria bacterium]
MEVLGKIKDTLKSILEWTLCIFLFSLFLDYLSGVTEGITKLHKLGTSAGYIVKGLIGLVKGLIDVLIDKDGREERFAPFQHFEKFRRLLFGKLDIKYLFPIYVIGGIFLFLGIIYPVIDFNEYDSFTLNGIEYKRPSSEEFESEEMYDSMLSEFLETQEKYFDVNNVSFYGRNKSLFPMLIGLMSIGFAYWDYWRIKNG